jgi:uncharacterized membrane protein
MSIITKAIEVEIPIATAYEEWTRFEDLTRFLPGVTEIRRAGERRLHWRANVAGIERTWELEIVEQVPEQRVAWRTLSGPSTWGSLAFERLSPSDCLLAVEMHYDPQGFLEIVTDYLGIAGRWVARSLERFKRIAEAGATTFGRLPRAEDMIGQ